jgi:hypothetical protein
MKSTKKKKRKASAHRANVKAKKNFSKSPAQPVSKCPKAAKGTSGPQVQSGNQTESEVIKKAHEDAKAMLDHVINQCLENAKNNPSPALSKYFDIKGTSEDDKKKINQLIDKYKKMRKNIDTVDYEVEHETIKPGEPFTLAYVYTLPLFKGVGDVHVVFPAFEQKITQQQRAGTLVHEMSHYALGTDDHAYEWQTAKWNKMTQKQKMNNADNFSGFAESC